MKRRNRTVRLVFEFDKASAKKLLKDHPGLTLQEIVVQAYEQGKDLMNRQRPIGFRSCTWSSDPCTYWESYGESDRETERPGDEPEEDFD